MDAADIPTRFPIPFASGAGPTYSQPVPELSPGIPGRASLDTGFPPENFIPTGAGGTPPWGLDFNGILNQISAWAQWSQAGGPVPYNAAFQTDIGGYPAGAIVQSATTVGLLWLCTVDNNVTDPDAAGAGWRSISRGRLIGVQRFTASGTYTPTPGMAFCVVRAVGGGGAGGGATIPAAGNVSISSPGTSGSYIQSTFPAATIGASKPVTIGAAGVAAVGQHGLPGGSTSLGALVTAGGGGGGQMQLNVAVPVVASLVAGAAGPTGTFDVGYFGAVGGFGVAMAAGASSVLAGAGGSNPFGSGAVPNVANQNGTGPSGYGGGGGGVISLAGGSNLSGGGGGGGYMEICEYAY